MDVEMFDSTILKLNCVLGWNRRSAFTETNCAHCMSPAAQRAYHKNGVSRPDECRTGTSESVLGERSFVLDLEVALQDHRCKTSLFDRFAELEYRQARRGKDPRAE